jgi:4-amino-4-deoxy-L-arabinose transferase-like glycosyltransferase
LKINNYKILTGIFIIAAFLRFWGIWHGYPYSYYPDEQHFVNRAVSFGSGDLNPHWFHKPALFMYLLFFEYGLYFIVGKILGFFSGIDSFAVYYFQNSWPFILIGRITVALFGIATVYMTYRIGKEHWNTSTGMYGSILLALSYGHVLAGQDVKADVPTTFFTAVSIYYLLKVVSQGYRTRDYVLSGIFAGLGTATKYYSIVLLTCVLIISIYEAVYKKRAGVLVKYVYSILSFWIAYFVASPFNFLDPLGRRATFIRIVDFWNMISPWKLNIYQSMEGMSANHVLAHHYEGHYILKSVLNYIQVLFSAEGTGIVIGTLFILSTVLVLRNTRIKEIILLSFVFIFSVISIIDAPSYTEPRHQQVIYPFLSIVSGIVITNFMGHARLKKQMKVIFVCLLVIPVVSIISNNKYVLRSDTRTLAKKWIESNIRPGTKMLMDESSVYISPDRKYYEGMLEKIDKFGKGQFTTHADKLYTYRIKALPEITYDITFIRFPWWRGKEVRSGHYYADTDYDRDAANPLKPVGIENYEYYARNGFEYAIVSSDKYEKFMNDSVTSNRFPSFTEFYKDLFNKAHLVKEFIPDDHVSRGPTVKIFKFVS